MSTEPEASEPEAAKPEAAESDAAMKRFKKKVLPVLEENCFYCHADGEQEGGISLEKFESGSVLDQHELWHRALKQLRAGLMPPPDEGELSDKDSAAIQQWIKEGVFRLDPKNPDPGHVTVRRLNRIEYRNTIRELMGVDFDTLTNFPSDDSGHGFDNLGEVLSLSPLLLEKYLNAANAVVAETVPLVSGVPAETYLHGKWFLPVDSKAEKDGDQKEDQDDEIIPANMRDKKWRSKRYGHVKLPYYEPLQLRMVVQIHHAGGYKVRITPKAARDYHGNDIDYNRCRLRLSIDGETVFEKEFSQQNHKDHEFSVQRDFTAGVHNFDVHLEPLTDEKHVNGLRIELPGIQLFGPDVPEYLVPPRNYAKYFPKKTPEDKEERVAYTRELITAFARRTFRRPADEHTISRLVEIAGQVSSVEGNTFEQGIAQTMVAMLASPRFLFREELPVADSDELYPLIDEYALASRLSYLLWSSMPDDELMKLADENKLRENLKQQVDRMLADKRSDQFFQNFTGQWLQTRDIDSVQISAYAVLRREQGHDNDELRNRFRELRRKPQDKLTDEEKQTLKEIREAYRNRFKRVREFELDSRKRQAMRSETEMLVEHIVRENRSLLEIIDANYTFLNETLAKHYEIEDVKGKEMRLVELPADSPRGGVLTQGSFLAVTSNPDRTSPVKRGLFMLDNLLGTPTGAPPPNIPSLEDAEEGDDGKKLTLRETLAVHRENALCSSCHNRMDPLGLALENFNALGRWREQERSEQIDASGKLVTGEKFEDIRQLKRILVKEHDEEFYQCATEKLMTYALGRSLDYHDVAATDPIVKQLIETKGSAHEWLYGVINSAPFQRMRKTD